MNNSFLPPVSQRSKQFASLNGVGHRGRMRSKILQKGGQTLEDYELLEMLLYLVIPRRDTKPLAKYLINHFGSLSEILYARKEDLLKAKLSPEFIELVDFLNKATDRLVTSDSYNRPYLKRWKDVIIYLNDYQLKGELNKKKMLRLLYLNNQQRLICDEYILHQGVETISLIIQKALNLYAMNLVTVYYVEGEDFPPKMRQREAKFALTLQSSGRLFDLNVSDHIICMNSQYFSIFKNKNFNV